MSILMYAIFSLVIIFAAILLLQLMLAGSLGLWTWILLVFVMVAILFFFAIFKIATDALGKGE